MEPEVRQLLPSGAGPRPPGGAPSWAWSNAPKRRRDDCDWQTFALPSEPGNERPAMQGVADAEKELKLPEQVRERLKSANPKEGRY
jgi:hypothetical protein